MKSRTYIKLLSAGVIGMVAMIGSVSAHHSYASFDMAKTQTVEGTVSKWEWTNPHAFLYVTVKGADGGTAEWEFESTSPAMLSRSGFTRGTFKPGDKVTVNFRPHRTKANIGSFESAILADGKKVGGMARPPGQGGPGGPGGPGGAPPQGPATGEGRAP